MEWVVLGFNGSAASLTALDWVGERAARRECRVEIIRIDRGDALTDGFETYALERAHTRLQNIAPNVEITQRTVLGRMPQTLMDEAAHADLLVIGMHRHRPVRSALTGWRPLRAIARTPITLVVVPDDWRPQEGPVLVAVDDDDSAATAVRFAADEAAADRTHLSMVHAWQMPAPTMEGAVALLAAPSAVRSQHRGLLNEAWKEVEARHPGLDVDHRLVQDNPAAAILNTRPRPSLVVLGTHHRGVMAGAFLGSVLQDVLPSSPVPVCVVPLSQPD